MPYSPKPATPILQPAYAPGLALDAPFAERAGAPRDLVGGATATATGNLTWSAGVFGPARDSPNPGGGNAWDRFTHAAIDTAKPLTVECWITFRSFKSADLGISGIWSCYPDSTSSYYQLRLGNLSQPNNAVNWGYMGTSLYSNAQLAAGVPHHLVGVFDGARLALYVDGAFDNATPLTPNSATFASSYTFRDDSGRAPDAQMHALRLYRRALSAGEIKSHFLDPFAVERPRRLPPALLAGVIATPATLPWGVGDDGPSYGFFEG